MPGSVAAAAPSQVLPLSLSQSFTRTATYPVRVNEYPDGHTTRYPLTTSSRKSWSITKRLTNAQLTTLLSFIQSIGLGSFYFYDGTDTTTPWAWDVTGVSVVGRYTVRFAFQYQTEFVVGRSGITVELIEVA